jgi:hypothetical protein
MAFLEDLFLNNVRFKGRIAIEAIVLSKKGFLRLFFRAFWTSESESADFSEVQVRKFRTLKTLRTRTQRVCLFTHLYSKEVNISQKNSEISIFSFLKSYYSLYKPHAQISTIVKTS